MGFEFALVSLGSVAKLRSGFSFKSATWQDSGNPVIKITNVKDGRIDLAGCGYVSDAVAKEASEWWTKSGDVLIAMTGHVGVVALIGDSERYLINQRVGRFESTDDRLNMEYLFYVLRLPSVRESIKGISRGSVQANLSAKDAEGLQIPLPPIPEQTAICSTLRALDKRIDLIRQTNTTLEAIAQALFKSWFVDFDPVRAKAEGREPEAMGAAIAALFPSEFEESELGLIPKGWRPTRVGDVVTIVKGRSYKSSELEASDVALVTLKSFNRGGGFRRDGFKPYTGTYKDEQVVLEGECIVAFTDVTQQAELIGRTAIVTGSQEHSRLVASLDVGVLRPKIACLTPAFLRALLSGERYVGHIKGYTTGTTVLHLAKDGLPSYLFVMPPDELIASWQEIGGACIARQALNARKIDALTDLRDTLLPRMISGKLRLPEAETAVKEALA